MHFQSGLCLLLNLLLIVSAADSQSMKREGSEKPKKEPKHATAGPRLGIKTPGVQIPFASLKAEAEYPVTAQWLAFSEPILISDKDALMRLDAKTNKLGEPVAGVTKPCGGTATGFGSLWVPSCANGTLLRLDSKTLKITAGVGSGVSGARLAVAASTDSVWILSDDRTTLSRVDPDQNKIVAELRLWAGCNTLTFGETALWVTCPSEDRVLRVDPQSNLVDKYIAVSARPEALAIGEGSVWVYCRKEGKVERIDPKTNKTTKTIELGVPAVEGAIAVGQGSVWVTQAGFPVTRIDPQTDKVVQQFWGAGGGAIQFGAGSVWLTSVLEGTLWRLDPKRISATLAE